jgi:hypothetical protein
MSLFLIIGTISVILFLLDIKYGIFLREFLYEISSYDNDHKVTVGNLIWTPIIFCSLGLNILYSICVLLCFLAIFAYKYIDNINRILSQKIF